jgi:hypothetical protein
VSGDHALRGNATHRHHGETAIEEFRIHEVGDLVLGHGLSLQVICHAVVAGIALALLCRHGGGGRHEDLPESDPQEELKHGTGVAHLPELVVRFGDLGHVLKAVRVPGEANKFGHDKSQDGQHGRAAVPDLGVAEEGKEGLVGFAELQRIELEGLASKVDGSWQVVHCHGSHLGGCCAALLVHRSKGCSRSKHGSKDSRLHRGALYCIFLRQTNSAWK